MNNDSEKHNNDTTNGFLTALFNFLVSGYYLDLKKEKYYAIGQKTEYNKLYGAEDDWSRMDDYIRECINEEDQALITKVSRIDYIRTRLKKEQSYSIEVRDHGTGKERWYRYTTMRGADADHAAISFADVTDQVMQRLELQRLSTELKEQNNLLEEKQAQLEEAASEQEAQLEEITALNEQIANNQAELEASIDEQHTQINEIQKLNQSISEYNDALANAGYGMWHIILKDGVAPRMQVNEKMAELLGIAGKKLSEEELYNAWYNQIVPDAIPSVQASVGEMLAGKFSENTYQWTHPTKGVIYVRCGGTAKKLADGTNILSGYHADVTDIVYEEKKYNEELEAAKKKAIEEQERVSEAYGMIKGLSQDYHTIWLVNKETSRMQLIRSSGVSTIQNAVQMGKDLPEFDKGFDAYISTYVEPQDRERMHREIAFSRILKELEKNPGKLYAVNYLRRDDSGHVAYHQIAFANADTGDGKKQFVYGFRDVDSMVKEEQRQKEELKAINEQLVQAAKEREEQLLVSKALSKDYLNVFQFNIETGISKAISLPKQISELIQIKEQEMHDYQEIINRYLSSGRVYPEDLSQLRENVSLEHVRKELQDKEEIKGNYRILDNDDIHYYQFKFRRVENTPYVLLGFLNIDDQVNAEIQRNQQLQKAYEEQNAQLEEITALNAQLEENQAELEASVSEQEAQLDEITQLNQEILEEQKAKEKENLVFDALAASYLNIYMINIPEQTVEIRKLNGYVTKGLNKEEKKVYPYETICESYIKNRVLAEDQTMVRKNMALDNLLQKFQSNKEYEFTYRIQDNDGVHFYQGKYVLVSGDSIVCGFTIIDDLIAEEQKKNALLEKAKNQVESERARVSEAYGMIKGLSQDYHTIWLVNKETSKMQLIRSSGVSTIQNAVQMGKDLPEFDKGFDAYISTYVEPQDRERMHREIAFSRILKELEEKPNTLYAVNYLRRDDSDHVAYHQIAFANADTKDGKKQFVYGFRDVDSMVKEEQRQKEELKAAKESAEAADKAKTSFLFNMSHDVRTPMNAVLGYTDLIKKHRGDWEKCDDYLKKIKSSGDFLLSLINNVLEMARIESGKSTLDEEIISIKDFDSQIESVYSELMKNKHLTFIMDTECDQYLMGDKVKLNEIFLNLVSNAYKYTPEGGRVEVHTKLLPGKDSSWVNVQTTVMDTGIGMSQEYLPKLFEEFTREHTVAERGIQGTGLGMPIVKKLITLMNGTITVESEQGKGTTFVITIPHRIANAPEIKSEDKEIPNTESLAGKRILLAEDNDLNAEIATEILSEFGFEVERAEDGIICVNMLQKAKPHHFDVILMDVQMPNMDGYKATQTIRNMKDNPRSQIPIIAMTANAFESDRQDALKAGMNEHIAKPIKINDLINTLVKILK